MLDTTPTIKTASGVWQRTFGQRWTSPEFRAPIVAWMNGFVETHNWASRWMVSEEIGHEGINVCVPRMGDAHMPEADLENFAERPGPQITLIYIDRNRNRSSLYLGLQWPHSHLTSAEGIQAQLDMAKTYFETTHPQRPT